MIRLNDLNLPKGLNIGLLKSVLPEKKLVKLILENWEEPRTERRIILPSKACLKKCLCYYYGTKLANGEMNWNKIMNEIKNKFGILKETNFVDRKQVKKLFHQREREILRELRDS